jgi:hypothetical protein
MVLGFRREFSFSQKVYSSIFKRISPKFTPVDPQLLVSPMYITVLKSRITGAVNLRWRKKIVAQLVRSGRTSCNHLIKELHCGLAEISFNPYPVIATINKPGQNSFEIEYRKLGQ